MTRTGSNAHAAANAPTGDPRRRSAAPLLSRRSVRRPPGACRRGPCWGVGLEGCGCSAVDECSVGVGAPNDAVQQDLGVLHRNLLPPSFLHRRDFIARPGPASGGWRADRHTPSPCNPEFLNLTTVLMRFGTVTLAWSSASDSARRWAASVFSYHYGWVATLDNHPEALRDALDAAGFERVFPDDICGKPRVRPSGSGAV